MTDGGSGGPRRGSGVLGTYADAVDLERIDDSPPRRPRALLQAWVREFIEQGHQITSTIRVVDQEDSDGRDTGLVVVGLVHGQGSVYIEPVGYDNPLWQTTLGSSETDDILTPYELAGLAAELVVAGNLCSFLQWKSLEWDRDSGHR